MGSLNLPVVKVTVLEEKDMVGGASKTEYPFRCAYARLSTTSALSAER